MRAKISKMSFLMRILSLLCLVLFYGCGVSSLYGPAYYDETNLGEGLMRVTFKGGEHPITGELCLLRCAEVCLESGYSHFEVVDSETGSSLQKIRLPPIPFTDIIFMMILLSTTCPSLPRPFVCTKNCQKESSHTMPVKFQFH